MGAPRPAPAGLFGWTPKQRPPEWAIPCPLPMCCARPNTTCRTPTGLALSAGSHPTRLDTWLVQQATQIRRTP